MEQIQSPVTLSCGHVVLVLQEWDAQSVEDVQHKCSIPGGCGTMHMIGQHSNVYDWSTV